MATIATITTTPIFQYPAATYLDRPRDNGPLGAGHQQLFCMTKNASGNFELFRSTNNGTSWSTYVTLVRANVQEWASLWADSGGIHWMYRTNEGGEDRIFFRYFDYNSAAWGSETMIAWANNSGSPGSYYTGIDFTVVDMVGQGKTVIGCAIGANVGGQRGVHCFSATGTWPNIANANGRVLGAYYNGTGTGRMTPSVDMESTNGSDGKSATVPHMWVAFGRANIARIKFAWTGFDWQPANGYNDTAGGFSPELDYVSARYDGQRFLICTPYGSTGSAIVWEINQGNTTTSMRISPVHPQGVVTHCTVSYNNTTGDFRIYAIGTSTAQLYYTEYIRATSTYSAWTQVLATTVLGSGKEFGVRRSNYGNSRFDVYTGHTNLQTHTSHLYNSAPTAPTWVLPTTGGAADVAQTLFLDWQFNDPNAGDTQGSYAISRQIGAGALNYWRASDSTWQVAEVQNASSTTNILIAASWGSGSDANYTFKVKTWDAVGLAGPYGAGTIVIPSVVVNPTMTNPTSNQVVATNLIVPTWTVSEQTQFRVALAGTDPQNLITNPFFETDVSNWTTSGGAAIARSTAQFHEGAASMSVTPDGATALPAARSNTMTAQAGISYRMQCWLRGNGVTLKIRVSWIDANNVFFDGDEVTASTVNGTWQKFVGIFEAPPGTVAMRFSTYEDLGSSPAWFVDEVRVDQVVYDSGWKAETSPVTRSWTVPTNLPNNTSWTVSVTTRNNEGLPSYPAMNDFTVAYIAPSTPALTTNPIPASGIIRITLSNPSATGAPATFVNFSTPVTANNASLAPTRPASVAKEDLLLIFASIRNSASGSVNTPTGWTNLISFGNLALLGRYAQLDAVDNPTVTFAGGGAGDDTLAQMVAFRGAALSLSANATVLNGSAANVAYPSLTVAIDNQIILINGWKQDAWTSVATLAGMTEIGDFGSAVGNDASEAWDYVIQTAHANITGASFTVTGGISAISRGMTLAVNVKPAMVYQDLYRRVVGDTSSGLRVATLLNANATYDDYTAVSGVNYEYRSLVFGVNGTSTFGAWTQ